MSLHWEIIFAENKELKSNKCLEKKNETNEVEDIYLYVHMINLIFQFCIYTHIYIKYKCV